MLHSGKVRAAPLCSYFSKVLSTFPQVETARTTCTVIRNTKHLARCPPSSTSFKVPKRCEHSGMGVPTSVHDLTGWQKMKWDLGFYGKLQVANRHLKISGYNLYVCCTDFVDFPHFFKELELPDTFNSWFVLLQVHMWLVNVKLSQMGKEGELLKRYFYISLWHDVEKRLQSFEDIPGTERRKALESYYSLMLMSIMYYDEGLLGDDKTLANALWLQLFGKVETTKAEHLDLMVEYVRKQVYHLDKLETYPIMRPGFVSFLPLHGDRIDQGVAWKNLQMLQNS